MSKYYFIAALLLTVCIVSGANGQQNDDEERLCLLPDYITVAKIFITEDKDLNLAEYMLTYSRNMGNGSLVTSYFTVCGDLPPAIKSFCGVAADDKTVYTFAEVLDNTHCYIRKSSDLVTARWVTRDGVPQFDLVYKGMINKDISVMNFVLDKNVDTKKPLTVNYSYKEMSQIFTSRPASIYTVNVPQDYVEVKGQYWFGAVNQVSQFIVGGMFFILFVICTAYNNHLSEFKGIFPFNFYINFYIVYRLLDILMTVMLFPLVSRWLTTPVIIIIPMAAGWVFMKIGPVFTHHRSIYMFYIIVLTDLCIAYAVTSFWMLFFSMFYLVILMVIPILKIPVIQNKITDKGEWVTSMMIALNICCSTSTILRSTRNVGAVRLIYYSVTPYFTSQQVFWFWIGCFVLLPAMAYFRYRFSDKIICDHYEKISNQMDVIIRLTQMGKDKNSIEQFLKSHDFSRPSQPSFRVMSGQDQEDTKEEAHSIMSKKDLVAD